MAEYWPRSFFYFYVVLDQDEVEVNKNAKKNDAILTNQT